MLLQVQISFIYIFTKVKIKQDNNVMVKLVAELLIKVLSHCYSQRDMNDYRGL